MSEKTYGTSGGVPITRELIEKLSREAEKGYPLDKITPRERRGRPAMGSGPATAFQVRLEPELRADLQREADRAGMSPSEVVRRALRVYLKLGLD